MISVEIPGWGTVSIENLVLDFNGTIALDGVLCSGVGERIRQIASQGVNIYVITADTNGSAKNQCQGLPMQVMIYDSETVARDKFQLVERLGPEKTMAIGNGRNDLAMIEAAGISAVILGQEGCYAPVLQKADIVVPSILDGLDLLLNPHRLKATLRG